MRFVVYGAGAIGGVVGARLFEHGHDVMLIARGEHFAAISERGLRIEAPDGTRTLQVPVVDHPGKAALRAGDIVLLAMKSQDTADAVRALAEQAPALPVRPSKRGPTPSSTPVVCLQNGVENERVALRSFSDVYGVCVMCAAAFLRPGVVQAYSAPTTGILDVGRYPAGADEVTETVAAAFRASSFLSQARGDIMRWKYRKLIMNLANAAEAVCGPDVRHAPLPRLAWQEGVACLRAAGIDLASEEEDARRRGDHMRVQPLDSGPRPGGSSWQSLHRGVGTVEADYLNGEIALLGRLHGFPTPVNELLQRLANQMAREGAPPGSVTVDEVMAMLGHASTVDT